MQRKLADTWHRIMGQIPGVKFNFAFWDTASPRRATYPACRAVIAARLQGEQYDTAMTRAIQHAYYLEARNPSDESTLIALADEIGLDSTAFTRALRDPHTQKILLEEIARSRAMQADSFPSLVLEHLGNLTTIPINYTDHHAMLETVQHLIANSK
jgi:putative protein-disulfide isomerase